MFDPKEYIRDIADFPKKGIIFKDIGPLLSEKFPECIKAIGEKVAWDDIDMVAGVESRGFIFGAALAQEFNKGFISIRKKGKLPPPVIGRNYELEYGSDRLELAQDPYYKNKKILLVDDVLATGGTLNAARLLCEQHDVIVKEIAVLIDLTFLNNFREDPNLTLRSLIQY